MGTFVFFKPVFFVDLVFFVSLVRLEINHFKCGISIEDCGIYKIRCFLTFLY
jgi:hypothetical protein